MLDRHQSSCNGGLSKDIYAGGVFQNLPSALDVLKEEGIHIDPLFVYPYRATYDFETYFKSVNKTTFKTKFVAQHVPLSVSVCSNVPNFTEPKCFITNADAPQELVDRMGDYLEEIADMAYAILREDFALVFEEIETKQNSVRLRTVLENYLRQMPVVGFNSGKYDRNVIKPYFIRRFVLRQGETPVKNNVIKRNNDFISVSTEKFEFLDMINYIAPGFSYSKYLAAYKVPETKGIFPYEYLKDLEQLEETTLPPKEAFYSSFKNTHISEADYEYCQKVWKDKNMTTLRDFLIWYNNKDVGPFIQALQTQTEFYQKELKLDMLKHGKTIPGLTLRYLFQNLPKDVYFSLINTKHADLHTLIRDNICGGPSIIFHRYHEKGITKIRGEDGKTVQRLLGYDANALYLWALAQDAPTEHPIRRRKENNFRMEKVDKFGRQAREWLEWTSFAEGVFIRHKFNGQEHSLGDRRIRVNE